MARGTLRLYLGAAPGVGKTYSMLNEGWRRKERGTDVVIGWVQEHGRRHTDEQIRDLEIFPRRSLPYRGQMIEEMDVDGLIARHPDLVLVDELAHSNAPGSRNTKRWQDVEELLVAGINVISTINLQHLESLNDVVTGITGVVQHETVPDPFVRGADQIELVDMAPEALRRRLAHGNVYPPERIDAALVNYFRVGNLTALRELALLWVADRVDEELQDYRERHRISGLWETRERVVVSLTGSKGSEVLIRRAARMAMRTKAELVGVHVRTDDAQDGRDASGLDRNRTLLEDLGGRFVEVVGTDVAPALVEVARAENATQLVLGATHRSRLTEFVRGSIINAVIRAASGALDIHVIATGAELDDEELGGGAAAERRTRPRHQGRYRPTIFSPLSFRRRVASLLIGVIGFPLLTWILTSSRDSASLATALSSYLVLVVVVAALGGVWPAAIAGVVGFLLSNYYFTPPIHTFTIANVRDVLALVMFLVTAGVVSILVDRSARQAAAARQASTDARTLARIAGRMMSPEGDPLPELLGELTSTFRFQAASVLRTRIEDPEERPYWDVVGSSGIDPPRRPEDATEVLSLTDREVLALRGSGLPADDLAVLSAFTAQVASALERERLSAEAADAEASLKANELRAALLSAVSHDLRTPLAGIKVASSSLLAYQDSLGGEETRTLLEVIDGEADRLAGLVANLLDMSRLQAGATSANVRPTEVSDVLEAALASVGPRGASVEVGVPADLPMVRTDPVLLERVVANLVDNALLHGEGRGIRLEVGAVADRIILRVLDQGPGIPMSDRARVLEPFQRSLHSAPVSGVGLGLSVARGFIEAVGGELDIEDTPGGGCTIALRLPAVMPGDPDTPEALARQDGDRPHGE